MAVSVILNLTDIHSENLLVSDGLPVILDFETLFTFKETSSGLIDNTITDVEATLFIEPVQSLSITTHLTIRGEVLFLGYRVS